MKQTLSEYLISAVDSNALMLVYMTPEEVEQAKVYDADDLYLEYGDGYLQVDDDFLDILNDVESALYDAEGNLLETIKDCELDVKDMYRVAELPVNAKKSNKATKIADYLRTQKGLIRILLPTQFGDGFDMRIPCLNND